MKHRLCLIATVAVLVVAIGLASVRVEAEPEEPPIRVTIRLDEGPYSLRGPNGLTIEVRNVSDEPVEIDLNPHRVPHLEAKVIGPGAIVRDAMPGGGRAAQMGPMKPGETRTVREYLNRWVTFTACGEHVLRLSLPSCLYWRVGQEGSRRVDVAQDFDVTVESLSEVELDRRLDELSSLARGPRGSDQRVALDGLLHLQTDRVVPYLILLARKLEYHRGIYGHLSLFPGDAVTQALLDGLWDGQARTCLPALLRRGRLLSADEFLKLVDAGSYENRLAAVEYLDQVRDVRLLPGAIRLMGTGPAATKPAARSWCHEAIRTMADAVPDLSQEEELRPMLRLLATALAEESPSEE